MRVKSPSIIFFSLLTSKLILTGLAHANEVSIVSVSSSCSDEICSFDVTLEHEDTGWDHYADYWQVIDEHGTVLGKRVLHHPHVNEQPFTRSLGGIKIPKNVKTVWIEAHDSVHGLSGNRHKVELQTPSS